MIAGGLGAANALAPTTAAVHALGAAALAGAWHELGEARGRPGGTAVRAHARGLYSPPVTTPRLVLVRHGRPSHDERGWYDAAGMRGWLAAYDAAGLAADEAPPPDLVALARDAALVAASDLPRARESAALLAPDAPVVQSPLLRETPPAFPALGPVRLPLAGWALAVGMHLAYRSARGVPAPAPARRQAREAAHWLARLGEAHGLVVAVTHASVRALIADALALRGWARGPVPGHIARRHAHWSAWTFAPAAAEAAGGRVGGRQRATTSTPTS